MRARTLSAVRRIRCLLGSASLLRMGFGQSMSVMEGVSRVELSLEGFLGNWTCDEFYLCRMI